MSKQNEELKKAGLKATLPRIKIMEVLASTALQEEAHFSAEDIYKELISNNEDIGLATIYRVLTQFAEERSLAPKKRGNDSTSIKRIARSVSRTTITWTPYTNTQTTDLSMANKNPVVTKTPCSFICDAVSSNR